jgi:hypothetical protein
VHRELPAAREPVAAAAALPVRMGLQPRSR